MPTSLSQAREALARLDEAHEHYYETLLDPFTREVMEQVTRAVASLTSTLRETLSFDTKKRVELTFNNQVILGKIDQSFEDLLQRYGYQRTIEQFVNRFPGQLPFLHQELDIINSTLKHPLLVGDLLVAPDLAALLQQQKLAKSNLIDVAATVGDLAKRKILLNMNGLAIEAMSEMLAKSLHVTTPEATTLGATSAAMFYRTAYSRVIDRIEASRTEEPLRYSYDGPRDALNRPFCRRLVDESRAGKTWTRAEFEAMDNGQLPNPFITGGGYRCRHQTRLALGDLEA